MTHSPTVAADPTIGACIDACDDCWRHCIACASAMAGLRSENDCPRCCMECAAICRTCVELMTMGSTYAADVCAICADACDWCGDHCAAHNHDHCQRCAAACRACADACRKMIAIG